ALQGKSHLLLTTLDGPSLGITWKPVCKGPQMATVERAPAMIGSASRNWLPSFVTEWIAGRSAIEGSGKRLFCTGMQRIFPWFWPSKARPLKQRKSRHRHILLRYWRNGKLATAGGALGTNKCRLGLSICTRLFSCAANSAGVE